jgi:hypothetical protein
MVEAYIAETADADVTEEKLNKAQRSLKVGDRVKLSRDFLRNTGQMTGPRAPTSYGPFARGEIIELTTIGPLPIAVIEWDDKHVSKVNVGNLYPEKKPERA